MDITECFTHIRFKYTNDYSGTVLLMTMTIFHAKVFYLVPIIDCGILGLAEPFDPFVFLPMLLRLFLLVVSIM